PRLRTRPHRALRSGSPRTWRAHRRHQSRAAVPVGPPTEDPWRFHSAPDLARGLRVDHPYGAPISTRTGRHHHAADTYLPARRRGGAATTAVLMTSACRRAGDGGCPMWKAAANLALVVTANPAFVISRRRHAGSHRIVTALPHHRPQLHGFARTAEFLRDRFGLFGALHVDEKEACEVFLGLGVGA